MSLLGPQPPIASAPPIGSLGALVRSVFVVVVGLGAFGITYFGASLRPMNWLIIPDILGAAAGLYLYVRRRELPVAVAYLAPILGWGSSLFAGAGMLATFSMATRRRWQEIVPNAILSLLLAVFSLESIAGYSASTTLVDVIMLVILLALFYAAAIIVGTTRESNVAKRGWAVSEERLQDSRVQEIRALERSAIAREMHDVLAHRISMVALHSGALAYRTDMPAEQVRETAQTINENARLALSELRQVLGTLRSELISDDVEAPQPTLARLPQLWEEANSAVAPVEIIWNAMRPVDVEQLQDSVSRNAYRVIQESLTNARKHAPGIPVQVNLSRVSPTEFTITVVNKVIPHPYAPGVVGNGVSGAVPRSNGQAEQLTGFGLIGMAERVRSSGGTISAGIRGHVFVVEVHLPWSTKENLV